MINWELNFSTPYAQKLANGEIGSAQVHARVLTDQYIKAIKLGAPVAIPPTLPSGIPPFFPPVPVGPGTYFNLYETRRMLFQNTIYTYFQAKAILNGQTNIKDAVKSLKRLQKKARQIRDQIKTTTTELKIITKEIENLPQEFVEFYNDIKGIIEFKIKQIKSLQINAQDSEYVTQQKKELLQKLFGQELATYDAIVNFKPTLNPADYTIILNAYTTIKREFDKLLKITSSEDEFKKYILKELQNSLEFILALVPGLLDPTELLTILADAVTEVTTITPLVKKAYTTLISLLKKTKYLNSLKLRLDVYIKEKKKELNHYVNTKIKKLKKWIDKEISELKKRIADYQARLDKSKYIKLVREDIKKAKVKIQKTKLRIQILKDISTQITGISSEVQYLLSLIKAKWIELFNTIKHLATLGETVGIAIENAKSAAQVYLNDTKEKQQERLQKLKTLTPQQGVELTLTAIGKASKLFDILINLGETQLSDENLKKRVKKIITDKVNEINNEYKTLLSHLLTTIIKAQTLKKLIAYDMTLKVHSDDINTIQREYTAKLNELKKLESDRIKADVDESVRIQKPTFKDLVLVFDELTTLVGEDLRMTQQAKDVEAESLQLEVKKALESNKFLKNFLKKKNAKIQRISDNKLKIEAELKEKQVQLSKQKTQIQKAKLVTVMGRAAGTVGINLSSGRYTISDNEQPLQKFIESYYDYRLLDHTITKAAHDTDLKNIKDKLQKLKNYEIFITLLVELFKDLKSGNFVTEFEDALRNITEGTEGSIGKQLRASGLQFLKKLLALVKAGGVPSSKDLANMITDASVDAIDSLYSLTQLIAVESKYTKRVLGLISAYENATNSKIPELIDEKNHKLKEFFKDVRVTGSVLITCIKYAKKYLIEPSKAFIKQIIEQEIDKIKEKYKNDITKLKKYTDIQKRRLKDKLVNVDAKVMSVMFGTAARLFWTGASWTNPAGTTFVVTTIGPFIPIKALPKDGADGMAREIGDGFNNQLAFMTGLAFPNPSAAIPPFPFNGYI